MLSPVLRRPVPHALLPFALALADLGILDRLVKINIVELELL